MLPKRSITGLEQLANFNGLPMQQELEVYFSLIEAILEAEKKLRLHRSAIAGQHTPEDIYTCEWLCYVLQALKHENAIEAIRACLDRTAQDLRGSLWKQDILFALQQSDPLMKVRVVVITILYTVIECSPGTQGWDIFRLLRNRIGQLGLNNTRPGSFAQKVTKFPTRPL